MDQITQDQAIKIYKSGIWENWTDEDIVKFQLFQKFLAIPFYRYHEAMEKVLGRPVFTHEFAYSDILIEEYKKDRPAPTFQEIIDLIPKEKLIIIDLH